MGNLLEIVGPVCTWLSEKDPCLCFVCRQDALRLFYTRVLNVVQLEVVNSNVFGMARWRTVNCSLFVDVFHSQFETLVGVTTLIVLVCERTFTVLLMGGQVLYGSRLSL